MPFDFKKEYRELLTCRKSKPQLVEVPPMNYIAVRALATRNEDGGGISAGHQRTVCRDSLHAEMSYKTDYKSQAF